MPRESDSRATALSPTPSPGAHLLSREHDRPRKAGRIRLARDAELADAIGAALASGTEQILANRGPALRGDDPEGVHQMRVGARRLRSALSLFEPWLPEVERRALGRDVRWLIRELGAVRDLDVFRAGVLAPLSEAFPDSEVDTLAARCEALRRQRGESLRRALHSPRYHDFATRATALVDDPGWRRAAAEPARRRSAPLLDRRERRVAELGSRPHPSPRDLHRLRIAAKRLRYATEFLGGLHRPKRARRYRRALAGLQDLLGEIQDAATAKGLLAQLDARELPSGAGLVSGWAARSAYSARALFDARWTEFQRMRPFWRGEG